MFDDRGLSNTLGFVLLFGVVFVSIGVVGTVGFNALSEARDGTVQMNGEDAVQSVQEEIQSLRVDDTTLRSALLRAASGTISADSQSRRIRVDVGNDGSFELDRQFRPLVFSYADTEIVYEAGAVIRVEGGGQLPISPPTIADGPDKLILPVTTTGPVTSGSSVSSSTLAVYLQKTKSELVTHTASPESVRLIIDTTPQRAAAWREMVDNGQLNPDSCSGSGGTVDCVWTRPQVIVRDIHVEYELVT